MGMIRTVWLTMICLLVLGGLAVGKALMTRADYPVVARPADRATVGTGLVEDALGKADRLEITYVRQEVPAAPALQPAEAIVPTVSTPAPPVQNKIISRHWRDPSAFPASAAKAKQATQTVPDKKSKSVDRKVNQAADRFKPADPVKPCSRPVAFGDLLRSMKLSPACDS
jgi:hypothetical protein